MYDRFQEQYKIMHNAKNDEEARLGGIPSEMPSSLVFVACMVLLGYGIIIAAIVWAMF